MMLVAKRRLRETWRDAVGRRAAEAGPVVTRSIPAEAVLAEFDRMVGEGAGEALAAYRSLERHGLLWPLPATAAARPAPGLPPPDETASSDGGPHRP